MEGSGGRVVDLDAALRHARAGDERGFADLYRAHQPALVRYLRLLVGQDAEDVAAETWLQASRDFARFRGDETNLRPWLVGIGRHRALDHLRAQRRRGTDPVDPLQVPQQRSPDDTEALTEESIATRRALAFIAQLPPDQAEAVVLRVVVGLDAPTAAAILGKRAGAVRTATSRGLARLAALLDAQPEQGVTLPGSPALNTVR